MRAAVVGAGRIGAFHARTLARHPQVAELLIADADYGRAEALAGQLGAVALASAEAALARRPSLVVVATPTPAHATVVRAAVRLGIPTFCEKPLTAEIRTTRALLAELGPAASGVQVGFQRRFDADYQRVRAAILAGSLGRLYSLRMVGCDADPPPPGYLPQSGGIFRDLHIHDYDLMRWLTGQAVAEAYAMGANPVGPEFDSCGDFSATASVLRLADDTLVTLVGARHNADGYDVSLDAVGARGTATVSRTGTQCTGFLDRFHDAYVAEMHAFVAFAHGDSPNLCPADCSLEALYVAEAALRSARAGRGVPVAEIRATGS